MMILILGMAGNIPADKNYNFPVKTRSAGPLI